jgi:ATP phosphoribosyltransferase regulatory subunit
LSANTAKKTPRGILTQGKMSKEEKLALDLRALYRRYGYQFYKAADFEPYDLYRENKNFLPDHSVLTFPDREGRLMALKPDVTISVAKDVKEDEVSRKLFYSEHVFRRDPGASQFREIKQMGLEYIGALSGYAEAEVLSLACQSLDTIGGQEYFLSISHMGYIAALMDELALAEATRDNLLLAIRRKSAADIVMATEGAGLSAEQRQALASLIDLPADYKLALAKMAQICLNQQMRQALDELSAVLASLTVWGLTGRIRLELSLLNDLEYYNGIVFQGYLRGLPRAVLSGGRYDNLLQRFGKSQAALGFALYFNELADIFEQQQDYDIDTLLLYGDEPPLVVAAAVNRLLASGVCVRAEQRLIPGLRYRRLLRLADLATEEGSQC